MGGNRTGEDTQDTASVHTAHTEVGERTLLAIVLLVKNNKLLPPAVLEFEDTTNSLKLLPKIIFSPWAKNFSVLLQRRT